MIVIFDLHGVILIYSPCMEQLVRRQVLQACDHGCATQPADRAFSASCLSAAYRISCKSVAVRDVDDDLEGELVVGGFRLR